MTRKVGFLYHPAFLKHDTGAAHPERPQRLMIICEYLKESGLWQNLIHIAPERVRLDVLSRVHSRHYIEAIERACLQGSAALDADTVVSAGSWEAALRASGAVVAAVDGIFQGKIDSAFCAVRPPGHHALPGQAMGFCLFNNVAIGARYAQEHYPVERVWIVDWDVHHGNSTQAIFEEDPSVLYCSTHQFPFYPGTGAREEQGVGPGRSFTVNVPLPEASKDAEFLRAIQQVILPRAIAFEPQLIFISAGFDAYQNDPLGGLNLTEEAFAQATRFICEVANRYCNGRIISVLEGGYDLKGLSLSVEAHLRVLLENGEQSKHPRSHPASAA